MLDTKDIQSVIDVNRAIICYTSRGGLRAVPSYSLVESARKIYENYVKQLQNNEPEITATLQLTRVLDYNSGLIELGFAPSESQISEMKSKFEIRGTSYDAYVQDLPPV